MKLIVLLTALASLLSFGAAQLGSIPDCGKDCTFNAMPKNCGMDVACVCKNKAFFSEIACCIADKCNADEQKQIINLAKTICQGGGVTDIPTEIVCSTATSVGQRTSSAVDTTTSPLTVNITITNSAAPTSNSSVASTPTHCSSASGSACAPINSGHGGSETTATVTGAHEPTLTTTTSHANSTSEHKASGSHAASGNSSASASATHSYSGAAAVMNNDAYMAAAGAGAAAVFAFLV